MFWPFNSNKSLILQRRAERDAVIEEIRKELNEEFSKEVNEGLSSIILSSSIDEIVQGIEKRKWTSLLVVQTFIRQSIVAHDYTNCLTEVNFIEAIQQAKEVDNEFEKSGNLNGPLHGIPFSLKDQYHLKGKRSATGYSEWFKTEPQNESCSIAKIAFSLGAICIAKTNVPQTLFSFECRNPAWGQTSNPYSKQHTAGGSSGGEAALLSIGGSAFGIGSDFGGSLRIPTSYCGIYALKTTNGRSWPKAGGIEFGPAPSSIKSVAGPMCRSLSDLELLVRLFTNTLNPPLTELEEKSVSIRSIQRSFNSEIMPYIPLQENWFEPLKAVRRYTVDGTRVEGKKLRIGWYTCDGYIKQTPVSLRAMEIVKDALKYHAGDLGGDSSVTSVELIEIDAKKIQVFNAFKTFVGLTSITRYDFLRKHLGADGIDRALFVALILPRSSFLRFLIGFIASWLIGDRYPKQLLKNLGNESARKLFEHEHHREDLVQKFEKEIWTQYELDAIICPVQATCALPHYGATLLSPLASSTILYNVLRNPVVVVPVTRVNKLLDNIKKSDSLKKKWENQTEAKSVSKTIQMDLNRQFDAEQSHGLPFGVQIVTREFEDEKAIGIAKLLDDSLAQHDQNHRKEFGPGAWKRWNDKQKSISEDHENISLTLSRT